MNTFSIIRHFPGRLVKALAVAAPLLATSCAMPGLPGQHPLVGSSMTLDAEAAVEVLATKSNSTWQDSAFTYPPLLARREASKFRTLAATATSAVWTASLPAVSSAAGAFRHAGLGTGSVYVATESPAGTPQVFRLDAATGAPINGAGWDVLAGLSAPGTIQRTALLLSADNRRVYLLTSGGYFVAVDADNGERLFAQKLSSSGFTATAPFIDYSNGGGRPLGSAENLYAVSNDGSQFRVAISRTAFAVTAWPSEFGADKSLWPGRPLVRYGGAVTVNAPPVVWQGRAYFGSIAGKTYRVDLTGATPVVTTWDTHLATSALNRSITTAVSVDFNAQFQVSRIFVPCGDRLAWIDPAKQPVEDAVVVSPPLLVDKTTSLQGTLANYVYGATTVKGPYDCLDFISIATKANPAPSRWGNGTGDNSRIIGADGYSSPADGNGIRGYMQFEIPVNDFAGGTPVAGRIDLSAASSPVNVENVQLYRASNYMAGTNLYWTGMNYEPDIDWNSRPELLSGVLGSYQGSVSASDATTGLPRYSINFADPMPGDKPNIAGRVWATYAIVSAGKQRDVPPVAPESSVAARWRRAVVGHHATEPKLYITVDNAAKTPLGNGLRCQAALDSVKQKIWVMGSNAVFELSFANREVFQQKREVRYNMTAAGRGASGALGPVTAESPKRYILPAGNLLYTGTRLVAADSDPGANRFFVNDFQAPLSSTTDQLGFHHNAGAGSGQVGGPMLFDFQGGSAYMTTLDKRLVRVDIQ